MKLFTGQWKTAGGECGKNFLFEILITQQHFILKKTAWKSQNVDNEEWTVNSLLVFVYEYNLTIMIDIIEVNSLQTLQEFFKQGIDTLDRWGRILFGIKWHLAIQLDGFDQCTACARGHSRQEPSDQSLWSRPLDSPQVFGFFLLNKTILMQYRPKCWRIGAASSPWSERIEE